MITKEQFIKLLNEDLSLEYAAAIQYVQHAAVITGPEYQAIQKEMIVHSNEEMNHAYQIAEQIDYLGGTPTLKVGKCYTDTDSKTILAQDLDYEKIAIKRYKERIKQAQELEEYGVEEVLRSILLQEEEHERDLLSALNK